MKNGGWSDWLKRGKEHILELGHAVVWISGEQVNIFVKMYCTCKMGTFY